MSDHNRLNRESRDRLAELVERLDRHALGLPMGEHWTVAAGLLHLSFWDRFTLQRWSDAERMGLDAPRHVDDFAEDLVNDTLTPLLLAASAEEAPGHVLEAARAADDYIARLPAATTALVESEGRPRLIHRSIHRLEHVAEIEALLRDGARPK